jgi:hypothetical protein
MEMNMKKVYRASTIYDYGDLAAAIQAAVGLALDYKWQRRNPS